MAVVVSISSSCCCCCWSANVAQLRWVGAQVGEKEGFFSVTYVDKNRDNIEQVGSRVVSSRWRMLVPTLG